MFPPKRSRAKGLSILPRPQKKFLKGLDLVPLICENLNDLEVATNKKSLKTLSLQGFDEDCYLYKRRARDSNPRRLSPQQFSRLPQSTTLPALRCKNKVSNFKNKRVLNFIEK